MNLDISSEYLLHVVTQLESFRSHPLGFRVAGTPEERQATAFVAEELRDAGLTDVVEEPVPVDAWRLQDAFVELAGGRRFECASFGGVPETGPDGIRGQLVYVGRAGRKQLDGLDVGGNVALVDWEVERLWPYHVGLELGLRGAAAIVVTSPLGGPYYQAPGALGTFDGLWHAEAPPCVTIRKEDAAELRPHEGEAVRVVLSAPLTPGAEAANVVGILPGRRDGAPSIVAGHHDGWFGGAFDDASAVAVTLALARAFAAKGIRLERPIAFVSHTAEEYGIARSSYDWCYGAWYQVVVEHREWSTGSSFYLNVEGSGRPAPFVVDAPPELTGWTRRICQQAARDGLLPHGYRLAAPSTWTEVWPFLAAGIPGINVSTFTSDFDRTDYHTQYDTSDRIDFDYLERLTRVCARLLLEADVGALDYAARSRDVRRSLGKIEHKRLYRSLDNLARAEGRKTFTAVGRGLHGLDAREAARYPHEQTAADVRFLEAALAHLRVGRSGRAANALARVGLNWVCGDLGREAFRIERARRGRLAPRACWAAQGDPDIGPDLWDEIASLRGETNARPQGPWLERSLGRHLAASRRELARRLDRMAAAADGKIFPLPRPRPSDLPGTIQTNLQ
ncbi:MAG: M20/M25/M40 family metallo-hydrolase [Actinomycetota bacterium]|nr:M20/M25/M40 family metallo-hydrolase [Actinomycetota bacterium]